MRKIVIFWAGVLCINSAPAQWEREDVGFEKVQDTARELANRPYAPPSSANFPAWMAKLNYDQYKDIRFNQSRALWIADNLPFRAAFYHPGYLFREPVTLNEFTKGFQQRIRFAEGYFTYGHLVGERGVLPEDGGFGGFRLHAKLNNPNYFDELISFQGASYWRALGKNQHYGLSSRGLALDTGIDGVTEEFPAFREFWLRKPEPNDDHARFYALLDGPSYSGAYAFRVTPGEETIVDVRAVLFVRKAVKRLGIAPMSSMFWFGENSRRCFDDFRPEVHDSDGLAIRMNTGERIWRPITNDSGKTETSFFAMDKCDGFGLLQRDRRFAAYEDAEALYHQRPSLWIEPTSDWGSGRVMLLEIAASNELHDNVVALWEPNFTPTPGQRLEFSYRQKWTMDEDPAKAGGRVVATRTGVHDWQPEQRTVTVDFAGDALAAKPNAPLEAIAEAHGPNAAKVKIQSVTVQPMPEGRVRVAFQIAPSAADGKLAAVGPVELRCALKRGADYLTETWVYRITP
ncbi:MAG: glucan biosynthesis protein [Verrucomicrobiota bacterium]